MNKSELRKAYLERRSSLSPDTHSKLSADVVERISTAVDLRSIGSLHCYISLPHFGEIDTATLFDRVWDRFPQIVTTAPRIDEETDEIDSIVYQRDSPMLINRWKIPEPAGSEKVAPETLDLVIVPLVCFDRCGHRVGYGRGFYDRLLQKCRPDCIKAGLSFFPPVDQIEDVYEGDVTLDLCVTPDETYEFT